MPIQVNESGTWRTVQNVWVNQGGTWYSEKVLYGNDAGTLRKVFSPNIRLDYLVVGGGGSGGGGRPDSAGGGGGGGGGGGVFASFATVDPVNFSVNVSIGAGARSPGGSTRGIDASPSTLTGVISAFAGGGYGGGPGNASPGEPDEFGGAGGLPNGSDFQYTTAGTFNGIGAGSGGRGRDDASGRLGGAGFVWPINKITYAGGGGGGGDGAGGGLLLAYTGGAGGGGQGGESSQLGYPGTFYGGGGGGGGGNNGSADPDSGGPGFSGVAIFSYVYPNQLFSGGVVTSTTTNGVTRWFHEFINNGTFTGV